MNYYANLQRANKQIDAVIEETLIKKGISISIPKLILETTTAFAISDKVVRKRIDLWVESNKKILIVDKLMVIEDE